MSGRAELATDGADDFGGGNTSGGMRGKPRKAPNAFRTISEVADELHIPQHVLRFWETKFSQVKPLKRGGGRRYYRPEDISLLRRVSDLLYIQGYTIKGVQRLLRESGGTLADDIPPPAADEQAAALSEPTGSVPPELERPLPTRPLPGAPPFSPASCPGTDSEVEHLRRLLLEALRELEMLRALLR